MTLETVPETLKEQWASLRPKLLDRWPEVGEDEFEQIGGDLDKLAKVLEDRYGLTRVEVMNELTILLGSSKASRRVVAP